MAGDLDRLVRWFEASEEATQQSRAEAEQARDYYDSKQLTAAQRALLSKRKQPIVWENLIRPKIDYLRGLERQSRTQPKALPRTAGHEDDAFSVTDALRYVADDQFLDVKRSIVFESMMIEGFGGFEIGAKRARGGVDPEIVAIPWDRLFYDPHSCQPDFSDAQYLGFVTWMDVEEAKAKWADKDAVIAATMAKPNNDLSSAFEDKPRNSHWVDSSRARIRVNTVYYRKAGTWHRAVYTLGGELEPCGPSPFLDEDGQPECALVLESAFVDRDNDRYGLVRDMIPLQDEVNKRRSKFLHHTNSRAVRVGPSATQDAETIRRELGRPDGVVVADAGDVEVIQQGDMAAGQFTLLQDTRASLRGVGPNAHLQGKDGQDQSGRAILALQQGGMTEMTPLLDNLRHFNIRVYRMIWNRIRQFWTAERWVRVTDDERNVRFVGFNITRRQAAMQKIKEAVSEGKLDEQTAAAYETQVATMPGLDELANSVAELDVDIDIDEVADTPALQIEQFEQLVKLASMNPAGVPWKMIVEASSLRDKPKLLAVLEEQEAAQAQPNPAQELAQREQAAKVGKLEAEAALTGARAATEGAKPHLEGMKLGLAA